MPNEKALTPETHNATSENLRKLARLIEMGQPLQARAVSGAIVLCVSAWEADLAVLADANAFHLYDHNKLAKALVYIEALKGLLAEAWWSRDLHGCRFCFPRSGQFSSPDIVRHADDCPYAALAQEEP